MVKSLAALAAIFMLVGCGEAASDPSEDDFNDVVEEIEESSYLAPETVTLNDGRTVECVRYKGTGGLWCTP